MALLLTNTGEHQLQSKISLISKNNLANTIIFNSDIIDIMLSIASTNNTTIEHVAFTSYMIFLFKLTEEARGFTIIQNKCESRVFYRLDPHFSFIKLSHDINRVLMQKTGNTNFDQKSTSNNLVFLNLISNTRHLHINTDSDIKQILSNLSARIQHDFDENKLTISFSSSSEIFNETLIQDFIHRFQSLCQQLFFSSFDLQTQPIYELSILLPNELNILEKLNTNIDPIEITTCIHQAFVQQAIVHPNKIAISSDDESLTYSELLHRVQSLALILINEKGIVPGDIICQYMDRSIEMIVGIMSIIMAGGIYVPLNPTDPLGRFETLVDQVKPKLILINRMSPSLNVPILDISNFVNENIQIEQLSKVDLTPESISHIVFTSGSSGILKVLQFVIEI